MILLLVFCTIGAIHSANTYWKHLSMGFTPEYWDMSNVTVSKFIKYLVDKHLILFVLLGAMIIFLCNSLGIPVLEILSLV
ncbi:MAG: hypothetical protein H9W82_06315 [Lactobacillus sp.]|nr:hypothetical protein [Lactobacillus sp.]